MAAQREFDNVLGERESLVGWVSGGIPKRGVLIEFPIRPPLEIAKTTEITNADLFTLGDHWDRLQTSPRVADDIRFEILVQQEGIDATEHAPDRLAHAQMLPENGGIHARKNRYASGFPSWDDQG